MGIGISVAIVAVVLAAMLIISDSSDNRYSERPPLYPNDMSVLPENVRTVDGNIFVDMPGARFDGATVYVEIHDTSLQDAPSILLKRIILEDTSYDTDTHKTGIPFSIPVDFEVVRGPNYSVRASIDVNDNGKQDSQDYGTTTSYPILNRGFGDSIDLTLERIR